MNRKLIILFAVAVYGLAHPAQADENQVLKEHPEWMACSEDADCTVVALGCYYWQPVNKKHADQMLKESLVLCDRSILPGLKPELICEKKVCK